MSDQGQRPLKAVGPAATAFADMLVLATVRALAGEIHPHRHFSASLDLDLDSDLDRAFGLDSLGRAELILRLDRAFNVRLPDRLIGEADTPRDLVVALQSAGAAEKVRISVAPTESGIPARIAAPAKANTLIDVLVFHAEQHLNRTHLFIEDGNAVTNKIDYGDLHEAARRIAFGLLKCGLEPGERVAIMLPTEPAFFEVFFGILYAGGVPVPVYPPFRRSQIEEHLRRQAKILQNASAAILVTSEELQKVGSLLFGLVNSLRDMRSPRYLSGHGSVTVPFRARSDGIALIQYTSGSTGDPKGVVLTHANLLANIRAMGQALEADSTDIFVSWLPLYHDMGLIGAWLGSLYFGATAIIMPPLAFLASPARWLQAISHHRATLSAAPNFAFELCCNNIRDEDIEGLDLSSLRLIANGAEPVSIATTSRFAERFGRYGFRPEMMGPVYGLAENSVGLAFPPLGRPPIADRVDRLTLSRDGKAIPAAEDDSSAIVFVACGQPIPGHEIRIVDESGRELPDRTEGRLQFRGPSATAGYFHNDAKNATLFAGSWLESGDRAYLAGGDIYITGRIKDMIIKAGRNIYPQEIEEFVGHIEGVRKGCVAAISGSDLRTGTERLVLVAETRITDPVALAELRQRIGEACTDSLEIAPDSIELVPPHTIPKTSSGKIRRAAVRQLSEAGFGDTAPGSFRRQVLRLSLSSLASRLRRLSRRGGEWAFAAYWWIALTSVAVVVWPAVIILPKKAWRHRLLRRAAQMFFWATGSTPQIVNPKDLGMDQGLFVANHASYLDSLVIAAIMPRDISFVAKEELSHQRIAGPFLRRLGTLFVRRSRSVGDIEDIEQQKRAVAAGGRLMTFPEGTLTRMPGLLGFQLGAFVVAVQQALPVIPIVLRGTRSILRGDQWFPRPGQIIVEVGEPLRVTGSDFAAAVQLRDQVRALILERCGEPDLENVRPTFEPTL